MTVVLFGCGVMGQILLEMIIKGEENNIHVIDLPAVIKEKAEKYPTVTFHSDPEAILTSLEPNNINKPAHPIHPIILAVKPYQVEGVFRKIKDFCKQKNIMIISIVAGLRSELIGRFFVNYSIRFIRIMTNVSAKLHSAPLIIWKSRIYKNDFERCIQLFKAADEVIVLEEEEKFNAMTALLGSAPAIGLEVIEGLALGGVRLGLARDVSLRLAAYAILGAGKLVLEGEEREPAVLRNRICTPGGCTIAGVESVEGDGLRGSMMKAIKAINESLEKNLMNNIFNYL